MQRIFQCTHTVKIRETGKEMQSLQTNTVKTKFFVWQVQGCFLFLFISILMHAKNDASFSRQKEYDSGQWHAD